MGEGIRLALIGACVAVLLVVLAAAIHDPTIIPSALPAYSMEKPDE